MKKKHHHADGVTTDNTSRRGASSTTTIPLRSTTAAPTSISVPSPSRHVSAVAPSLDDGTRQSRSGTKQDHQQPPGVTSRRITTLSNSKLNPLSINAQHHAQHNIQPTPIRTLQSSRKDEDTLLLRTPPRTSGRRTKSGDTPPSPVPYAGASVNSPSALNDHQRHSSSPSTSTSNAVGIHHEHQQFSHLQHHSSALHQQQLSASALFHGRPNKKRSGTGGGGGTTTQLFNCVSPDTTIVASTNNRISDLAQSSHLYQGNTSSKKVPLPNRRESSSSPLSRTSSYTGSSSYITGDDEESGSYDDDSEECRGGGGRGYEVAPPKATGQHLPPQKQTRNPPPVSRPLLTNGNGYRTTPSTGVQQPQQHRQPLRLQWEPATSPAAQNSPPASFQAGGSVESSYTASSYTGSSSYFSDEETDFTDDDELDVKGQAVFSRDSNVAHSQKQSQQHSNVKNNAFGQKQLQQHSNVKNNALDQKQPLLRSESTDEDSYTEDDYTSETSYDSESYTNEDDASSSVSSLSGPINPSSPVFIKSIYSGVAAKMIAAVGGASLPTLIHQAKRGGTEGAAHKTVQGVRGSLLSSSAPISNTNNTSVANNTSMVASYPPLSSHSYIGRFLWKSVQKIALACMVAADTDCLKPMPTSPSSSALSAVPNVRGIHTFLSTPLSSLLKDTRSAGLPVLGSMFYALSASSTIATTPSGHQHQVNNGGRSKEMDVLSKLMHSLPKDLQTSLLECATDEMRRKIDDGSSSTISSQAACPGTARGPVTSRGVGAAVPSSCGGAAPLSSAAHRNNTSSISPDNDSLSTTNNSSGQPPTEGLYMTPPASPSDLETDHHHPTSGGASLSVPATVTVYQSTRHHPSTAVTTTPTSSPANHSIVVAPSITIVMAPNPQSSPTKSLSSKKSGNNVIMSGACSLGDFGGAGQVMEYIAASLLSIGSGGEDSHPSSSSGPLQVSNHTGLVLAQAPRSWLSLLPTLQRCLTAPQHTPSSPQLKSAPLASSSVPGKLSPSSTLQPPSLSSTTMSSAMLLFVHKELVTRANEAALVSSSGAPTSHQRLFCGVSPSSGMRSCHPPHQTTAPPSSSSESAVGAKKHTSNSKHGVAVDRPRGVRRG